MSLRGFLEEMEKKGEVVHVKEEVSPRFDALSIMKAFDNDLILHFGKVVCLYLLNGYFVDHGDVYNNGTNYNNRVCYLVHYGFWT